MGTMITVNSLNIQRKFIFMPPTSKKLRGHIGLGLSVHAWCVTLCIRSRAVRNRILKFDMGNKYEK